MRKLAIATITFAALAAGSAVAADMPVKGPAVRPACAQFGGAYIGGHVGYGYYDHRFNDRNGLGQGIDDGLPSTVSVTDDSVNGGAQIGYNWQSRCTVFGIEADWSWSNLRGQAFNTDGDAVTQDTLDVSSRLRWFGTVRARTGVVVDNLLLYVTGGVAYANFKRDWTFFEDGPATTAILSSSRTKWGWTAGVGTEWAWTNNWSIKSEFLYMRFREDTQTFTGAFGGGAIGVAGRNYGFESQDSVWVSRIGLNYRWGGAQ
jgi:outer membrane immunogenic protein